ncbi:single-stranded DNA-binding protein [Treponema sp. R6D11]
MEANANNKLEVIGRLITDPVYSHESHGEEFRAFKIRVPRLSESHDILDVVCPKTICDKFAEGDDAHIFGEFRSFNNYSGVGARLILTVYVNEMQFASQEEAESSTNELFVQAFVCKKPIYRKTPFGREITDLLLAVNRKFNKSDYIPAIAWGKNAREAADLEVGDALRCKGRVQSREYKKRIDDENFESRIAYEYSISYLETFKNDDVS